jgi:hypothetical protein
MLAGLKRIVGRHVRAIDVSTPSFDATVAFDDGLSLRLFCDQTNEEDRGDNYSLFTSTQTLTVGCRSRLEISPRTPG